MLHLRLSHAFAVLFIVTAAVFGSVVTYEFVSYDDDINVSENKLLLPASIENMQKFWSEPYHRFYAPVAYTAWSALAAVDQMLTQDPGRLRPEIFHAAVLFLHGICSCLVFYLLYLAFRSSWAALAGALFFAVHPLQTESVAWITALRDQLSAAFGLTALILYLESARSTRRSLAAASTLAFSLAMLSKPSAMSLPLVALALAWLVAPPLTARRMLVPLSWGAVALPLALWTKSLQPDLLAGTVLPVADRFWVAVDALGFYLSKLFVPVGLAPDYGRTPGSVIAGKQYVWTAFIACAALTAVVKPRSRAGAAGAFAFFAVLLPVSGLVPFQFQQVSTVADRYVYLALLGPALIVAAFVAKWPRRGGVGAVFCIALLSAISWRQARMWRNDEALLTRTLEVNPQSSSAVHNLAGYYYDRGELAKAEEYYRRGLALDAKDPLILFGLIKTTIRRGDLESAERLEKQLEPSQTGLLLNVRKRLGDAYAERSAYAQASEVYRRALELSPKSSDLANRLAIALAESGRNREALGVLENASKLAPSRSQERATLLANSGEVLLTLGEKRRAKDLLREALEIDPGASRVRMRLSELERESATF